MKILLVNKFHYLKGGSEKYYFELGELLEEKGHEVAFFSMYDDRNIVTGNKEYFVENVNMDSKNILKAMSVIYSHKNKKKMLQAIDEFKPDIIHVNNFQRQLTCSILDAAKQKKVPTVFTAHDLQILCPASAMLNEGKICEKCLNGSYQHCVKQRCIKQSMLKSLLSTIEAYYYKTKKVYKKFDAIITPSDFLKNKIEENRTKELSITTVNNFINLDKYHLTKQDKGYAFFCGRLSIEKGIFNMLQAFQELEGKRLYIAGEGPEKQRIEEYIEKNHLKERIILLGHLNSDQIIEYLKNASFLILPSIWYENFPYSVIEALALGKAVIGSRIGGIPELVEHEYNGLLYEFNQVEELKQNIKRLFEDKEYTAKLGENSRKKAEERYSKQIHYKNIIKLYDTVIEEKKKC